MAKQVRIPSPVESMRYTEKIPKGTSAREAMGFAGKAPELINGRLAMLGFTHAVGFEIATGHTAGQLFWDHPVKITLWAALFSYATLAPILKNVRDEAFGPFTPEAEKLNGRAAMVGWALLTMLEGSTGRAFF